MGLKNIGGKTINEIKKTFIQLESVKSMDSLLGYVFTESKKTTVISTLVSRSL